MDFSKLFKFKKDNPLSPPINKDTEEPQGINGSGSLLHPTAPTGTRFNRKLIMVLGALFGIIMIFAFMSALQPPKKLTPQEQAEAQEKKAVKYENNVVTPDNINDFPDTYAGMKKYNDEQKLRRGELPAGGGQQNRAITPLSGSAIDNNAPVGNIRNVSKESINAYAAQGPNSYKDDGFISDTQKELLDARKSPIKFSNSPAAQQAQQQQQPQKQTASAIPASFAMPKMPWEKDQDQNMQQEKRDFTKEEKTQGTAKEAYLKNPVIPAFSRYEVKAGSIIPGVMITGINSDLPGKLVGQVRENVFDTVTGRYLLIPQGTRVIGAYDSKVAYAQERVLIVWTRLIFPNGDSIDLEGMDGVDLSGYAGLTDKVNNHWIKLITGVVLSSILSAGSKVAAGNNQVGTASFGQQAASGASDAINTVGAKFTEKNLNIQPTLEIRPGYKFNVFVNKDMILKRYKET
jgi:type IV secretory pathway VirB10-like protein